MITLALSFMDILGVIYIYIYIYIEHCSYHSGHSHWHGYDGRTDWQNNIAPAGFKTLHATSQVALQISLLSSVEIIFPLQI